MTTFNSPRRARTALRPRLAAPPRGVLGHIESGLIAAVLFGTAELALPLLGIPVG